MSTFSKVAVVVSAVLAISVYSQPAEAGLRIKISKRGVSVKASCGDCKRFDRGVIRPAVDDIKRETTNLGQNTEEAVRESGRFVRREAEVLKDSVSAAGEALADGNPLRAGYVFQRDYINGSVDNSVNTLQESSMLRTGAQIAAGAAFGPAGVGGFNAIYVYKVTGDSGLALKTGVVSGGSAFLIGQVATTPGASASEITGSAAVSGHVAGTANTLMGGNYEDGFRAGAIGSVAMSTYRNMTGGTPDADPSRKPPYSKQPGTDVRGLDWSASHVGMENPNPLGDSFDWLDFNTEHSPYLRALSKFPGFNAGAVGHDIWANDVGATTPWLQLTIPPLFVLSYQAIGTHRDDQLLETAVEERK
jgi:hypothetical protein